MNPPGDEAPLARFLASWAAEQGLEAEVVELPDERAPKGRAALVVRVRGRGEARPVILLSHLDVVAADPRDWEQPPFAGATVGGVVIGRGALDAKGVTVAHLILAARLAARERPLARDLLVMATPDEETGGLGGAARLIRERPELLANAEFLLAEGGSILLDPAGGPSIWSVGFAEKTPCWLDLRSRGLAGHGASAPQGGALTRLLRALDRVRRLSFPVRVVPEVTRTFRALAPLAARGDRDRWLDLERSLEDPDFRERFLAVPGQAARVRDTLAITTVHSGDGRNRVAGRAEASLDLRLLPGGDCSAAAERVRRAIDDPSVTVEVSLSFESRPSPVETDLMAAIERTAARLDPGALVAPSVQLGWSDAHWFRARGIVAYGFVPRRLRPIDLRGIHGAGERLAIDNLVFSIEALEMILEELAP